METLAAVPPSLGRTSPVQAPWELGWAADRPAQLAGSPVPWFLLLSWGLSPGVLIPWPGWIRKGTVGPQLVRKLSNPELCCFSHQNRHLVLLVLVSFRDMKCLSTGI